ncbi:MAG TPA: pyridoxamine 5'-phosphate oxidase family protein [candidate division Zixibacteria bacterium]|nr:pyridoxamine 5'-phosphate oxidase family protein [candidate division Zixibacteria bacterium]
MTTKVHDPELDVGNVLTDDLRQWMTARLRYPVLAVVDASGAPTQSVMWFDFDPDRPDTILMNTKTDRAKYRWLKREPRVSLLFEDELEWVALQGRVELDEDPERALADIKALARRYGSDPERFNGQSRVTIRMRVERVIRHD